ncbi:MAG TPA: transglutaminaseTgpA domain-containing protein [Acidimicrobiia bacterium]|nr:transglutaminaseTgpA domain-containing protein [Acidimicrobiia bacterium]
MMSALPLTALTLVAAVSFVRVFGETSSVAPGVVLGAYAHAVLRFSAAARIPPVFVGTALLGGAGLLASWMIAPHTLAVGVPTTETAQVLAERMSDGFGAIRSADVPIGPHSGIVFVSALGVFIAAIAADWVAFQARAVLSACIPAATLFTLTATLGEEQSQVLLTVAFVAATLSFVLAHAPAYAGEANSWFSSETRQLGPGAVLRTGLPIVAIAALVAPVLGPRLPEAKSAGLVDLAPESGGSETRVTVSPLVDIRDRLTQDPPVEVFTVAADRAAYWRMAALEAYDGQIWKSEANYERADDDLPTDSTAAPTVNLVQTYRITALAQFWLPAAYRPSLIDLDGARVNPDTLTLLTDRPTSDGLTYRIESEVPSYGPLDLVGETGRVPENVRGFLGLPGGFPGVVADLATQITSGRRTVYEKALSLQNFFRTEFAYNEEVPPGHSGDRLVDFVTTARAGFCEQFSAAFAAMARSIGIPARVAVGFTSGNLDSPTGTYHVKTSDAHAWPEVYIDPYGWVAFEPTPSRFNPSPANHTGTFNPDAQQAPPEELDPAATATTVVPAGSDPVTPDTGAQSKPPDAGDAATGVGSWVRRLVIGLLVLLAVSAGIVTGGLALARRRRRRRTDALDPGGAILMAWDDVVAHFRLDGVVLERSLTPSEAARRAGAREPEAADALDALRTLVDRAAYSASEPDSRDAATAWTAARHVVAVLERDDSATRRLRRRFIAGP